MAHSLGSDGRETSRNRRRHRVCRADGTHVARARPAAEADRARVARQAFRPQTRPRRLLRPGQGVSRAMGAICGMEGLFLKKIARSWKILNVHAAAASFLASVVS